MSFYTSVEVENSSISHLQIAISIKLIRFCFQLRDANDFMILIAPVSELCAALLAVLISCELAGRLTYRFEHIDHTIEQFKWYLFPLKLQKILAIIMISAQQPVNFECFGSIQCDQETFKKVRYKMNKFISLFGNINFAQLNYF